MSEVPGGGYGTGAPQTAGGGGFNAGIAQSKVSGPAIGLMVTAGVGIFAQLIGILLSILGIGLGSAFGEEQARYLYLFAGAMGMIIRVVLIILGVVVFLGAQRMKNLESYNFAMAAAIIALIPCTSPCCILGLPIGIWALVVLLSQDVKPAFRS